METKLASLSEKKDKYGDNLGWKVRLFDGNEVGGLFIDQEGAIKLEEKINKAADAWAASLVAEAVKKAFLEAAEKERDSLKERVKELEDGSYNMGNDLQAVHTSYRELIHERFEAFRNERLDYFENEWKPKFIENWIQDGRLIDIASGQVVWSKTEKTFVAPTSNHPRQELLDSVQLWSKSAIKKLEEKRKALLNPLDVDEKELTDSSQEGVGVF